MLEKPAFKWLSFYKIYIVVEENEMYIFEELDGLHLAGTFATNRIKNFHPHQQLHFNYIPKLKQEVVLTFQDFLAANDNNVFEIPENFFD